MIERMLRRPAPSDQDDLDMLTRKANRRYSRRTSTANGTSLRQVASREFTSLPQSFRRFPTRYITHGLVLLILPVSLAISTVPMTRRAATDSRSRQSGQSADLMLPAAPLAIQANGHQHSELVGDPPLPETDALPVPVSLNRRSESLAPLSLPATVVGEGVNMRSGPGTAYDQIGELAGDTPIQLIGRSGDWAQARLNESSPPFWVTLELVNASSQVIGLLNEVQNIPPPPPPKVARVTEDNLNLRDGPGKNYFGLTKLPMGQDLTLLERYVEGDTQWFNVVYGDLTGWVSAQFLDMQPGVAERIPIITELPDPNPPMVGTFAENSVNLRKGPGSLYEKLGSVDAEEQAELVARYDDWVKVRLSDGTNAWVFSDLIRIAPRVWRRVPITDNIPALPAKKTTVARTEAPSIAAAEYSQESGAVATSEEVIQQGAEQLIEEAAPVEVVPVMASGDVASFATQFVGYPYVYGATGPYAFDCSGLMVYVYSAYGVYLPRTAAAQFSGTAGVYISDMGSLAPGDLVFFAGTAGPGISHVAMYIGGGQVVHAMTPAYGVQISNLYDGYWQSHYYGAVRPYR